MNEVRGMYKLSEEMGRVGGDKNITVWVFMPEMQENVPEREIRREHRRKVRREKEERRLEILNAMVEYVYRFVTCGCCVGMIYLLIRMAM